MLFEDFFFQINFVSVRIETKKNFFVIVQPYEKSRSSNKIELKNFFEKKSCHRMKSWKTNDNNQVSKQIIIFFSKKRILRFCLFIYIFSISSYLSLISFCYINNSPIMIMFNNKKKRILCLYMVVFLFNVGHSSQPISIANENGQ